MRRHKMALRRQLWIMRSQNNKCKDAKSWAIRVGKTSPWRGGHGKTLQVVVCKHFHSMFLPLHTFLGSPPNMFLYFPLSMPAVFPSLFPSKLLLYTSFKNLSSSLLSTWINHFMVFLITLRHHIVCHSLSLTSFISYKLNHYLLHPICWNCKDP